MSEISQITDFDINLGLVLKQYEESTKLRGLISSTHRGAEELETALFEIRDNITLDTAEGAQLDLIGAIKGVSREGRSDTDYRAYIKMIIGLRFVTTPESIIEIINSLYGGTSTLYFPGYPAAPATFYLLTDGTITNTELIRYCPAGVLGIIASYLVDVYDRNIQDANGNDIICAVRSSEYLLTDEFGDFLVDEFGDYIVGIEFLYT